MEMNRRTFLKAGSMATVLAMTPLAGCGGSSSNSVSLLMVDQPSTKEMRNKFIPDFEEESGITVDVQMVPESGLSAKLNTSLSSQSGQYDVIMTGAKNWSQLVAAEWIRPLGEYVEDSELTPAAYMDGFADQLLETVTYDGEIYGMPQQVGVNLLFYNKSMFEDAGLDPETPPRDMAAIVKAAEQLTQPEKDQAGFVARGTREGQANSFSWIMMWLLNGGRWLGANGEPKYTVLDEDPAITTTEQYVKLMTQFAPSGASNYDFLEAQLAMQQGRAAMWMDAAQLGPALENESGSKIAGDVGYAAPKGQGEDYIVGPMWAFSMVETTKNEESAWELIKYLTGKEVTIAQAVSGTNGSPARTDVTRDPRVQDTLNPEFLEAVETAIPHANPRYTPLIPESTEMRDAISTTLSEIVSSDGQGQIPQAMNAADQEVRSILE